MEVEVRRQVWTGRVSMGFLMAGGQTIG
jgi:hypothetical protein